MRYNFDELTQRRNTNSLKWDTDESELPMWVADMDFRTAPAVTEAILKKAHEGIFGYSIVPDKWYDAYINWWEKRHNFKMEKDWLIFSTGVVPILSSVVRRLTAPAEKVLVQTPVYNIFFNSILNNGRNPVENRLIYENGKYRIDFDDLEKKLADPQTAMMILCNPHNPIGKIWDRDTLERIGGLCRKYGVVVVSDEIHCDLTEPSYEYIPFASVSDDCRENSITCIAPTKSFNIAGLQTAAACIPNERLRHKVNRGLNNDEVAEPNVFAVDAAVAAYNEGGEWLDELRAYISDNRKLTESFINSEIPQISMVRSYATYLLWLDCSRVTENSTELAEKIRSESGLYLCDGNEYHNGNGFLRMNIACPRERLKDGLNRLKNSINNTQHICE